MNITHDNLDEWLKQWGREFGQRRDYLEATDGIDEGEGSSGYGAAHPLARALDYAPGTRAAVVTRVTSRRDGSDRRRRMAESACEGVRLDMRVVGMAYVDHVPCTETRPDLRTPRYVSARQISSEVLAIQRAVMAMVESETASEYGNVLQVRYCLSGDADERAAWFGERVGKSVPVRAYRACLEQAKLVLLVKLGVV